MTKIIVIITETRNPSINFLNLKTMKNLIKVIVLFFVVSTLGVATLSAKTPPVINSDVDLEKAIKSVVDYPEIENNDMESTSVNVLFKIDFDGKIKVVKTEGCDKYCKEVRKSLEKLSIKESSMYGRYFSKKIRFELIK